MGRTNEQLLLPNETAPNAGRITQYRGETTPFIHTVIDGETGEEVDSLHLHQIIVYDDDSVEILEHIHKDENGEQHKHTHEYVGEYPDGYILEAPIEGKNHHIHKIISIEHPIRLETAVYGKASYQKHINRNFSQLASTNPDENKVDIPAFFRKYFEVFYDIPKEGNESHAALIEESLSYLTDFVDPRDKEIEDLIKEIVALEQKLAEQDQLDSEHPIFGNGTFLKEGDKKTVYYMDKGKKRAIGNWDIYLTLKRVQGHDIDKEDENVWITVTEDVIKGIDTGPKFRSEDLYGDEEKREEQETKNMVKLDPDDFKADPSNYPTVDDYLESLDREIRQKSAKEEYLEELYHRYNYDRKNITDPEDKADAQERFKEVLKELTATRNTIIKYAKILQSVDPDGDLKNIEIDTSQLKDIVTGEMKKKVTVEERRESLYGRNKLDNLIAGFKTKDTDPKIKKKNPGTTTQKGGIDVGSMAASMGMSNLPSNETKPNSPPKGFTPNPAGIVSNKNRDQAVKKMRLGASTPKGDWYWSLKPKNNGDFPTLRNPLYPVNPVSKYIWRKSQFEWAPKMIKRTWEGKNQDKYMK